MSLFRLTVLVSGTLLVALISSAASGYSYGDGYRLARNHSGGHSGLCALIQDRDGSQMSFCRNGDVFHLWDLSKNGKSIGVRWQVSNGHYGLCRWDGGAGTAGDCAYDFPESATVTFRTGKCNVTAKVDCKNWNHYSEKSSSMDIRAG